MKEIVHHHHHLIPVQVSPVSAVFGVAYVSGFVTLLMIMGLVRTQMRATGDLQVTDFQEVFKRARV